ncbi:hypothetical protein J2Z22_002331 [Paenibacillus forsythiae]|uniref:Uncharacterized protein n=1 Tax=Paenibacillus forsythiae TaxID=365616 RepID=A0ABU3H9T8_9BACL|nr:hypothetical protein [Paenibacillus forsythiae]
MKVCLKINNLIDALQKLSYDESEWIYMLFK